MINSTTKYWLETFTLILLALLLGLSLLPLLLGLDPINPDIDALNSGPGQYADYLFGTDLLGRDSFARLGQALRIHLCLCALFGLIMLTSAKICQHLRLGYAWSSPWLQSTALIVQMIAIFFITLIGAAMGIYGILGSIVIPAFFAGHVIASSQKKTRNAALMSGFSVIWGVCLSLVGLGVQPPLAMLGSLIQDHLFDRFDMVFLILGLLLVLCAAMSSIVIIISRRVL